MVVTRLSLGLGSFLIIVFLVGCEPIRQNSALTASTFVRALLHNDAEQAKALAADTHHTRIDDWLRSHTEFQCPSAENHSAVALRLNEAPEQWSYTVEISCFDEGFEHCFSVDEILLERRDKIWTILDWKVECDSPDSFCETCRSRK